MEQDIDSNITKIQKFISRNYTCVILKDRKVGATTALLNYAIFNAQFGDKTLFVTPSIGAASYLRNVLYRSHPEFVNTIIIVSIGNVLIGMKGHTINTLILDDINSEYTLQDLLTVLLPCVCHEGQIILSTDRTQNGIDLFTKSPQLIVGRNYE